MGPIYNPHGKAHGAPGDSERHVGSLGNIVADASSRSKGKMKDALVKIDGPFSVVGRSFTVHAEPDDLGKTKAGGVGARVACGQIKEPPPLSQAELMELHMAELKANQLKHQKLMGKVRAAARRQATPPPRLAAHSSPSLRRLRRLRLCLPLRLHLRRLRRLRLCLPLHLRLHLRLRLHLHLHLMRTDVHGHLPRRRLLRQVPQGT